MRNSSVTNSAKVRSFIISIALLAFFFKTEAQSEKATNIGIEVGTSISGNGHGILYLPQLALSNTRHAVLLGSCLQKQAMRFNGARIAYSFIVNKRVTTNSEVDEDSTEVVYQYFTGIDPAKTASVEPKEEQRVNFKLYVYAQYLNDNLLSHCTQKMETHVKRAEGQNWKTATLSTVEGGLGFEIGVKVAKNIYWNTFIAASFYYHTKYIQNMHHERFSPCITLGTSINIPRIGGLN